MLISEVALISYSSACHFSHAIDMESGLDSEDEWNEVAWDIATYSHTSVTPPAAPRGGGEESSGSAKGDAA